MGFANSDASVSLYPSSGERLSAYVDRLEVYLRQLEEWSSTHVTWWTHRSAGNCWICDLILMQNIMNGVMKDVCSEFKDKYKFVSEVTGSDVRYFDFKMKKL